MFPATLAVCVLLVAATGGPPGITGDYVEVRSSDVYSGSCTANSEYGLAGHEATLVWHVRRGAWEGVDLAGLTAIAVVKAQNTLGTDLNPYPIRSVLIVDERATATQRDALVRLASTLGGPLTGDVVRIETAPIEIRSSKELSVQVVAGDLVQLETRPLDERDRHCGAETVYYPPLCKVLKPKVAATVTTAFHGQGLHSSWTTVNKRSAFVATFER